LTRGFTAEAQRAQRNRKVSEKLRVLCAFVVRADIRREM